MFGKSNFFGACLVVTRRGNIYTNWNAEAKDYIREAVKNVLADFVRLGGKPPPPIFDRFPNVQT